MSGTWTVAPPTPRGADRGPDRGGRRVPPRARWRPIAVPIANPFVGPDRGRGGRLRSRSRSWSTAASPLPTERAGTMAVFLWVAVAVVVGSCRGSQVAAHDEVDFSRAIAVIAGRPGLPRPCRHSGVSPPFSARRSSTWPSGSGNREAPLEPPTLEILDGRTLLSTSPTNPVENAGFDDGLTGWTAAGGAALERMGWGRRSLRPSSTRAASQWEDPPRWRHSRPAGFVQALHPHPRAPAPRPPGPPSSGSGGLEASRSPSSPRLPRPPRAARGARRLRSERSDARPDRGRSRRRTTAGSIARRPARLTGL